MKLRIKKSEYQYSYALPSKDYFETTYQEQLQYRLQRREKENGHMMFSWESEGSDSNSDGHGNAEVEENKLLTDEDESSKDSIAQRLSLDDADHLKVEEVIEDSTNQVDKSTQTPRISRKSRVSSRSRNTRHASTSTERCDDSEKPPFLSYGWADDQIETGRKMTHNVHAPKKSVYPAALQRMKYQRSEKLKQAKKSLSRPPTALAKTLLQKKVSDTSTWQSEYQRCYSRQSTRPNSEEKCRSKSSRNKSSKCLRKKKV